MTRYLMQLELRNLVQIILTNFLGTSEFDCQFSGAKDLPKSSRLLQSLKVFYINHDYQRILSLKKS